MDDDARLREAAVAIAEAIGRRDVDALSGWLAPGFVYRTPGGDAQGTPDFLAAIRNIPGEIVFVRVENVTVDLSGDAAVVTGMQHARVRVGGSTIDDRRPFVDWFLKRDGAWRLRLAVDLPSAPVPPAGDLG